jgi:hypothetical protein
MAKKQSKKNKETGKRKTRKSASQKQKQREKEHERMTAFNKTKAEEPAFLDMTTRESALKQLGNESASGTSSSLLMMPKVTIKSTENILALLSK